MQWKGPFEIVTTVGINDYRINMGRREKTFHANLLKGYIARDQHSSRATTDKRPPSWRRKLCDQPRKVFQGNARPRMDSVRPLEPEKKFNVDNVQRRRRQAWLTRGRSSSVRRPGISLGTAQLWIVPRRRLVREW
ncbi:Zinc finger protein [Plakobranchus ocellatus]|uniref:Zinc finger protein n=1 Tax=Plakobranchus ocellatus TaxID=259542 RepID=A0AAV3YB13_9GAST|nr:Zinc finger protein [Plakobranchus ocellatus]